MDPNNTHEVIFLDNLYKLRPWLTKGHILEVKVTMHT